MEKKGVARRSLSPPLIIRLANDWRIHGQMIPLLSKYQSEEEIYIKEIQKQVPKVS